MLLPNAQIGNNRIGWFRRGLRHVITGQICLPILRVLPCAAGSFPFQSSKSLRGASPSSTKRPQKRSAPSQPAEVRANKVPLGERLAATAGLPRHSPFSTFKQPFNSNQPHIPNAIDLHRLGSFVHFHAPRSGPQIVPRMAPLLRCKPPIKTLLSQPTPSHGHGGRLLFLWATTGDNKYASRPGPL